ncbi:MAG: hypothetical protein OK449_06860 [Thaumarchaeota archaeon]|nr:hypothetical protein [Nitrososphaerota archaeon]
MVLCLLVLAGAMAVASEHLVPPVFGVRVEEVVTSGIGTGPSSGFTSTPGMLIVMLSFSSASSGQFTTPHAVNASISVVPTDVAPLFPQTYHPSSDGGLYLSLAPDNYSVSILDLPMNVSVPLQVHQGATTELRLTVTSNDYRGVFLSVPAGQTDVVPAWAHGTMELNSYVALLGSNAAFLDLYYNPGSGSVSGETGQRELQAPLLVTDSEFRSNATVPDQWVSFQPEVPISLSGLGSFQLSVYGAYANVTTYAGVSSGGISLGD